MQNLSTFSVRPSAKKVGKKCVDYTPFGMAMVGRDKVVNAAYRYGYNGMEIDPEMKGKGNEYTTEFRQYDPRVGRWMSLDPLMMQFPWMSPYCAFDNNPVALNDIYGLSTGEPDDPVYGPQQEGPSVPEEPIHGPVHEIEGVVIHGTKGGAITRVSVATDVASAIGTFNLLGGGSGADLGTPFMRGALDAGSNATSLGMSFAFFGGDHTDEYRKESLEQRAYLQGIIYGSAIAAGVSGGVASGAVTASPSGAVTLGIGTVACAAVAVYSGSVAVVATSTMIKAQILLNSMSTVGSTEMGDGEISEDGGDSSSGTESEPEIPKGYKETKEFGTQHGEKVYQRKSKYISKDKDGHIGGVWKTFEKVGGKLKRTGTADKDLNRIGK